MTGDSHERLRRNLLLGAWVMLLGILLTAVYGIVVRRRLHLADDVDDYEAGARH
ncbi:MAG: hypothetical protein ACLTSX_13785 [Collinsella sp.]